MKNNRSVWWGMSLVLCLALISGLTCSGDSGKIPITTSSEKAREYYIEGRDLMERLRFTEAAEYLEKAIEADPNFAMAYYNLSYLQPTVRGLLEMFEKALALRNQVSDGERLMILAIQAGNNADPMKQRELLQELVTEYPNDERAHNLLGTFWYSQQEFEKAIQQFNQSVEINDQYSLSYNMLGYSYRFLGEYKKAEESFKKYIELIPDDPNPYDSYAELRMKMGEYGQSIETYYEALNIDPNFVASHIGIATNLNYLGKHKAARDQLRELFDIARDDGQRRTALFAMAVSYVDEGQLQKAVETIEKQYQLAAENKDIPAMAADQTLMARILMEMKNYDKARQKIDTSLQLIENSGLTDEMKENARRNHLFNATRLSILKKEFTEAEKMLNEYRRQVIEINNPGQIRLSHELAGLLALEQNDYKTAINEFSQADQQSPFILYNLARAYEGSGDRKTALEWYQKAAYYNALNSLSYSLIRQKAIRKLPPEMRR